MDRKSARLGYFFSNLFLFLFKQRNRPANTWVRYYLEAPVISTVLSHFRNKFHSENYINFDRAQFKPNGVRNKKIRLVIFLAVMKGSRSIKSVEFSEPFTFSLNRDAIPIMCTQWQINIYIL